MKLLLLASSILLLTITAPDSVKLEDKQFFKQRIHPVLRDACFKCHGDKVVRNNLDLTTRAGLLKGGDNGPAIVPGKPDESLLIRAVRYECNFPMPPKNRLDSKKIDDLADWVKRGAPWPSK